MKKWENESASNDASLKIVEENNEDSNEDDMAWERVSRNLCL